MDGDVVIIASSKIITHLYDCLCKIIVIFLVIVIIIETTEVDGDGF